MFVRFFHLRDFEMQREGNCPLNAGAFAKLKLLTIFFSVFGNAILPWICGVDLGRLQREGNCPLNARAFAKLKLLTVFSECIWKCHSSCGSVVWTVDDCSGKAIAHSMPALVLQVLSRKPLPTQWPRFCQLESQGHLFRANNFINYVFSFIFMLGLLLLDHYLCQSKETCLDQKTCHYDQKNPVKILLQL